MWDRVNITLGIEQSLDTIFSAVLLGGIDTSIEENKELYNKKANVAKACKSMFIADFPFNIFCNSYAILYEIISTLKVTTFSSEQLRAIIDNNKDLILDSPYIDKNRYFKTESGNIASDDDIISAVTDTIVEKLDELSMNYVTEEDYRSSRITYIDWYKNALAEFTALNMAAIMSDNGFEAKLTGKRRRKYHGLNDMMEYYNNNVNVIKALSEQKKIRSQILDAAWLEDEMKNENRKDSGAMFTIGIREMDETIGNLRRGNMLGILGPPKGGKTKFANFIVNRALSLGYNVCVWPLEGTIDEWKAMQTACFIARVSYDQTKSGKREGMLRLSSKDILERKYNNSMAMRKEIAAAKVAMATSEKVGRLSFIEGTAYVEDMFDILQNHYDTVNPFDVLVIDSLVNVMSNKGMSKSERISEAYMKTKDFLANKLRVPALGVMPAQLKQDVVDFLRRNPDETIDVTGGGESAETIRTPDESIGLFSSKEERANNMMKIYSVASRHNASFDDFQARCYLECCFFTSEDDEIK